MISPRALRVSILALLLTVALLSLPHAGFLRGQNDGGSLSTRLDRLTLEVERVKAVRAVKDLQHSYAQYAQFGLWNDMASLFTARAEFTNGKETLHGREVIGGYFLKTLGHGKLGLAAGEFRAQLVFRPVINLSANGQTAKGRWWEFSMFGRTGVSADWAAGIYENEYVKEQGIWRISRLRYNPMFAGPYETGWRNVDANQKIVPYHFTPEESGIPVPEIPVGTIFPSSKERPAARLEALEQQIIAMNAEDKIRNLQNAYGYYVDRKMWEDVTDLFVDDGVLEIANIGIYEGVEGIRRALDRHGPAGLKHGQLHDHMQLDMTVSIESGGNEARSRGLEFAMLGDADKGESYMSLAVFENRYVKQNDIWKIREMRIFPVRKTDYRLGWAKSVMADPTPAREFAPDRAVPLSDRMAVNSVPVFFAPNPGTGKPVRYPAGAGIVAANDLLPVFQIPRVPKPGIPPAAMDERIKEAERKLAVSKAYDGTENVSSAYGDYLDDLDYSGLAELFALKGAKQIPFAGFYVGRESIARREDTTGNGRPPVRSSITLHLRTQPVILIANDGRSSGIRTRLFQPASSRTRALGFAGGMYHDQAVLEDGSWKLWSVAIDEHYFSSPNYQGGWSAAKDPPPGAPRRGIILTSSGYPPDIPLSALGERQRGFIGGTGDPIMWPSILPMWFHYRNPVSGRMPEYFWSDCVTCTYAPHTSMKNHGYLLPPW